MPQLLLTLYMNSDTMRALYRNPDILWLLFPLTLYWISRIWIITSRGEMDEDPVLFAVRDCTTILGSVVLRRRDVPRNSFLVSNSLVMQAIVWQHNE